MQRARERFPLTPAQEDLLSEETDGMAVLRWQLEDPDPVLRQVAYEALLAEEGHRNRITKPILPPIPEYAPLPGIPKNPDPDRLTWDAERRAFRLINLPTERCADCGGKTVLAT